MAVIPYSCDFLAANVFLISWAGMTTNDTGAPYPFYRYVSHFTDKSAQAWGTFGGSTILLEGSNKVGPLIDSDYDPIMDPAGINITWTAQAPLKQILPVFVQFRPRITGGAGSSINVTVMMVNKRTQ